MHQFNIKMFAGCKSQMTYHALNSSPQFSTTLFISVRATVFGSSPFRYQETDRNRKKHWLSKNKQIPLDVCKSVKHVNNFSSF